MPPPMPNTTMQHWHQEDYHRYSITPRASDKAPTGRTPVVDFKSQFNINVGNYRHRSYIPVYFVSNSQKEDVSSLEEEASNGTDWAWENTLNYSRSFGKHRIDGLLGITAQHSYDSYIRAFGQNLPADASLTRSLQYLDLA